MGDSQAIEQLNMKPKFWKDLLTDAPFTRKDIIHIQDPLNLSGRNVAEFHHVKAKLSRRDGDEDASEDPLAGLNASNLGEDAQRILAKLNTEESAQALPRVDIGSWMGGCCPFCVGLLCIVAYLFTWRSQRRHQNSPLEFLT